MRWAERPHATTLDGRPRRLPRVASHGGLPGCWRTPVRTDWPCRGSHLPGLCVRGLCVARSHTVTSIPAPPWNEESPAVQRRPVTWTAAAVPKRWAWNGSNSWGVRVCVTAGPPHQTPAGRPDPPASSSAYSERPSGRTRARQDLGRNSGTLRGAIVLGVVQEVAHGCACHAEVLVPAAGALVGQGDNLGCRRIVSVRSDQVWSAGVGVAAVAGTSLQIQPRRTGADHDLGGRTPDPDVRSAVADGRHLRAQA